MSRLAFHVSRRFAQSQRLLTLPRLLFSTGTAVLIPLALLGLHKAAIVWVTVVLVTVAAGYYGTAIIGGVVGDYLGATIQVSMSDVSQHASCHLGWLSDNKACLPARMHSSLITDRIRCRGGLAEGSTTPSVGSE